MKSKQRTNNLGRQKISLSLLNPIDLRSVRSNNPLAEFLPLAGMNLLSRLYIAGTQATILDTPFGQLFPAVDGHPRITDHDLVELV